ncbi:ribosomal L7Ae/L30e/S12e/Gadd45 family protein [Anoxybacillus sp. B7M1]|uniref:YlxQ family RNA-binding protein n=1 Tax=Anoxybacteroides rupiense TaxID=311460 RepID=A0ABD5IQI9_9BACL|nr:MULTISPECIES: YlxQ family RNA-binding protein [Anoxybacillus]ANB56152.1 ribosomal L7Ae/L30e/S12e/Gadd45 family protein [Anoxybacillus sp. B2M1]ANB65858.1 ribosomal L7Ae/L30e/S12e/Gadd45 family protein [Anoxybacillus sp. B7M1]KXG10590.1 putative ribosomal protein YlxQ [Anoxybacillus sp. P3H1B]MBS2771049.1 YlxQ family RNA-binding protein [Anoxybacillus rupiensis]MDE8563159.1 YlxQ family RNA-binding protein [Anoxybacillus rupiensis]
MGNKQWTSLLGLANRARKIVSGEELVVKEIRSGRAKLVILSEDAAANTRKKIQDKCTSYEVPLCQATDRYELGRAIGKDARVVVAVIDEGFAKKLMTMFDVSLWG